MARHVNLTELSTVMGLSTNTISDLIRLNEDFPIVERGSNGVSYKFDADVVAAWWRGHKAKADAADAERRAELAELQRELFGETPAASAMPGRVLTPAERKLAAEAAFLEDKLRRARGELADASEWEAALQTMLVALRQSAMRAVTDVARRQGLDRTVRVEIERGMAAALNGMAEALERMKRPADGDMGSDLAA